MKVHPANSFLIRIERPVAFMPVDKYIQEATKGPGERFYVTRGTSGGLSVSAKNCTVLACGIYYVD